METEGHVERLAEVFELIGKAPRAKTCDAILGILFPGFFYCHSLSNPFFKNWISFFYKKSLIDLSLYLSNHKYHLFSVDTR